MARTKRLDYRADELTARVQKTLQTLGCSGVVAEDVGNRTIRLSGTVAQADDKSLAVAVARTVPGVRDAAFDVRDRPRGS